MLFVRTLFPNYYFNSFEEIIAGEKDESYINQYIDDASKKILTHTKDIDVNNNETMKRMAVFHMIWITWPRF